MKNVITKKPLFTISKKDFIVQAFRGSGPGGQHRNKTDTAIRIIHKASGAVGESSSDKSQYRNKRNALKRLTESIKFKLWINQTVNEITTGKTIEERVEELINTKNLKVEGKDKNGRWIEVKGEDNE